MPWADSDATLAGIMRIIRFIALFLCLVVLAGWVALWVRPDLLAMLRGPSNSLVIPGSVAVGGPFALTDHTGRRVTDTTFRGKWMLIYFGYTYCPDVCPTELQNISNAIDLLGPDADKIVPVFITVDPARDTVAALADYVKLFDPRLVGLTGSDAEIAGVAKAYRVYYAKADSKNATTYLMDHSSFLYLVAPDGSFRALFRQGIGPVTMAKALRARFDGS
ncbi:MAG: SCO family protein [Alphaproteobacteria bacterium]|nr:SCO family protein [Alphaproteobacteria bacterium]